VAELVRFVTQLVDSCRTHRVRGVAGDELFVTSGSRSSEKSGSSLGGWKPALWPYCCCLWSSLAIEGLRLDFASWHAR
jgi:hypothetical protein